MSLSTQPQLPAFGIGLPLSNCSYQPLKHVSLCSFAAISLSNTSPSAHPSAAISLSLCIATCAAACIPTCNAASCIVHALLLIQHAPVIGIAEAAAKLADTLPLLPVDECVNIRCFCCCRTARDWVACMCNCCCLQHQ